ncbi:hypothetical protein J057_21940 [Marinobacter nanhaiticus D15-8W]|uniref:Uncharacterized protein n=1 Tax=Marinobacter nanhaiticus D15-8W TaxID=626887 RepID=N6VV86_9GAMM|nr:hypothetical protein J057_21940 [Marinobacter nanhaiticus D15-8W]
MGVSLPRYGRPPAGAFLRQRQGCLSWHSEPCITFEFTLLDQAEEDVGFLASIGNIDLDEDLKTLKDRLESDINR